MFPLFLRTTGVRRARSRLSLGIESDDVVDVRRQMYLIHTRSVDAAIQVRFSLNVM